MKFQNLQAPLLFSFFISYGFAAHISEPDNSQEHLQCDLACHNNGFCRFITEDSHLLEQRIQSGHMVHECICPMGFRGMSCEVKEEEHPSCDTDNTDKYGRSECDCVVADQMSVFAGEQCRKPFTEYGASLKNTIGGHISFCTNGGKLKGDLMAAQVSPGNTTNNVLFQHAGCVCPPEFTGEHCELLNNEGFDAAAHHRAPQATNSSDTFLYPFLIICTGALCVIVGASVLYRKLREYRNNPIHGNGNIALGGLPQPPHETSTFYKDHEYNDDEFVDPYNHESSGSSDEEEFKDVYLPEIA